MPYRIRGKIISVILFSLQDLAGQPSNMYAVVADQNPNNSRDANFCLLIHRIDSRIRENYSLRWGTKINLAFKKKRKPKRLLLKHYPQLEYFYNGQKIQ